MKLNFSSLAAIFAAITLSAGCSNRQKAQIPVFLDRTKPSVERARDLVGRLTLEEKASLMQYDSPAIPRLGIPAYNWWNEALHGVARNGSATVYPMPIGMAASFDPDLLYDVFTSVSDEARVKYNIARRESDENLWYKGLTLWTPNINIFRDPRWGRGMETYGEDPYLTGVLGSAVVKGLQGPDADRDGHLKTQACAKHLAVHSGPESSRHIFDASVSERDLRETYLPAFKELVTKAGVGEVMFAYNRFEGVPCGANERLLKDILRDEWGFDGLIVSDCWAISDFYNFHKYVSTPEEAVARSVKAGLDVECGPNVHWLPEAVRLGLVDEATVDSSVVKLLTVRFSLGEIDHDSPWDRIPESCLCSSEHAAQALQMARESMVLLQNDGTLPLAADSRIALLGPNAADSTMMWGNYNGFPMHTVTLLDALSRRCPDIMYIPGVPYVDEAMPAAAIDSLVTALEGVQTVVFAGGISPALEGEEMPVAVPGFKGGDRTTIELPGVQRRIVAALAAAGKKVVFVNFSGSAMALAPEAAECSAILQAWYPGQEGGTAVADVLYGDFNPCGKLPLTFYASDSQLPDFDNYDMAGRTYRYFKGEPLWRFGHGLSYTTFSYGEPRVRRDRVVVEVSNTGSRDGWETVQLYVSDPADTEGPALSLCGFKKVFVKAGRSRKVSIPLHEFAAPGRVLRIGGSSDPAALKSVQL